MSEPLLRVGAIYAAIGVLHLLTPGPVVTGYVNDASGDKLQYCLNGLRVMFVSVAAAWGACSLGLVKPTLLYDTVLENAFAAAILGFLCTAFLFFYGPWQSPHVCAPKVKDMLKSEPPRSLKSIAIRFFLGQELNPRVPASSLLARALPFASARLWDFKMFLYALGAVMLQLNIISCASAQWSLRGSLSLPMIVYLLEMTYFLVEYMYHEHVHLYTYDLVDENIGFTLTWGCFFFYPFFYSVGIWPLVSQPADQEVSSAVLAASVACFVLGYFFSRGANMQKYHFKLRPKNAYWTLAPFGVTLFRVPQRALEGRVLVSGLWGLSRHINYLGEILMAVGLALPAGLSATPGWWVAWLYPLYYVGLLFPRERIDNTRCEKKYGELWKRYTRTVPSRIIPFIY